MRILPLIIVLALIASGCNENELTVMEEIEQLFDLMPEGQFSVNADGTVYANYADPTNEYQHNILGDDIEAKTLVVFVDGEIYSHTLQDNFVFEDIRPRLFDVDNDGKIEFITILTHVELGAGIGVFKLQDGLLSLYAMVDHIGQSNKWLNIVSIENLDDDAAIEIAWIQTPHIGGTLFTAEIASGMIEPTDGIFGFSNHRIGDRNLCLSALTDDGFEKLIYVPNQLGDKVFIFHLQDDTFVQRDSIELAVDFSIPLPDQLNVDNLIIDNNCIQ